MLRLLLNYCAIIADLLLLKGNWAMGNKGAMGGKYWAMGKLDYR